MGFLNVAVGFSIFPTLLSALLLSVCLCMFHFVVCLFCSVFIWKSLNILYAQSSRKAVCSTELFKCFQSCTLNLQVPDHMPSSLVDFFSVFFFFSFPPLSAAAQRAGPGEEGSCHKDWTARQLWRSVCTPTIAKLLRLHVLLVYVQYMYIYIYIHICTLYVQCLAMTVLPLKH